MSGKIKRLNYVHKDRTFLVGNEEYFFLSRMKLKLLHLTSNKIYSDVIFSFFSGVRDAGENYNFVSKGIREGKVEACIAYPTTYLFTKVTYVT